MIYRNLGKTGMKAGIIGFGAENIDFKPYEVVEETVNAVLEHGINIMDLFMPGTEIREYIRKALGDKRNDMLIQGHVGSVMENDQYGRTRELKASIERAEDFLRIFGHMDIGMLFYIDTEEELKKSYESGFVDYVLKLKKEGYIRALGFSSHNPSVAMKVINELPIEVMLFSINPAFDMMPDNSSVEKMLSKEATDITVGGIEPKRAALYKLCEEKEIGITVMKTLGAGKLLDKDLSPLKMALTVPQCIHYALSRPAVVSTLVGAQSKKEVDDMCKYLTMSDAEKDYSVISKNFNGLFLGQCVYCNHCLPCPSKINIGELTRLLDVANFNKSAGLDVSENIKKAYSGLSANASDCIECGSCEANCPFSVKIIENMRQAQGIFEQDRFLDNL